MLGRVRKLYVVSLFLVLLQNTHIHADDEDFHRIYNQGEIIRNTKSREMLRYMNLEANPCEDFYEYACGNYAKYHQQHALAESNQMLTPTTTEYLLDVKIEHDLLKLLEEQVTLEDGSNGRKIKQFYKSCITAERDGATQQSFFSEFIKANGGFPAVPGSHWHEHHHNYEWQLVVAELRQRYGMDILLGLDVQVNYENKDENSIYLGEPQSTLIPRALCSVEGTRKVDLRDQEYVLIEIGVAERLTRWLSLPMTDARKLAADIVTFEFELCTAMERQPLDADGGQFVNYTRKTLIEFTHQFNDSIDFKQFVSTSFSHAIYKPVFMRAPAYFQQLIRSIEQHSVETVANYIMFRALSLLAFPMDDTSTKRPKYCVSLTKRHFPKTLGDMYYRQYGSNTAKAELDTIFAKLKKSLESSLQNSWLVEGSSRIGRQKLNDITLNFTNYDKIPLNNLAIESSKYWKNLELVLGRVQHREVDRLYENGATTQPHKRLESYANHLQYHPYQRRIDIPWAILQAPFYELTYPNSMKYALIGVTLAHTLNVAFDDIGWSSDPLDPLGLMKWDSLTATQYKNRSECFRQQFSNYLYNKPELFQNLTILRDLIANSGGLNVAFHAYMNWLSFMSPNNDYATLLKETLPALNLSNTQLFFVTFAQNNCRAFRGKQTTKTPNFLPMDLHTWERYAVNGPLRNFEEFAREFNCLPGNEMHPIDKCVIY